MKRLLIPVVPLLVFAAITMPGSRIAAAVSPWADHWETAFVHSDPADKATLDIRNLGRIFIVQINDDIPADAWNNPDCHGPARAFGIGTLVDSTHMRLAALWLCDDGGVHASVRFLRIGGIDDANPVNDGIAFCTGLDISTCGLVFHRAP